MFVYSRATPIGVNLRPPQATRKGWPYYRRAPGHPQGVALLYTSPRPPARGGPTIDERVVGLVEPPRIVGPPLAGGLRAAGLRAAGLRTAGLRAAGLRAAGLRTAGLRATGSRVNGWLARDWFTGERLACARLACARLVHGRTAGLRGGWSAGGGLPRL